VLTKRPQRMRSIVERVLGGTDPLANVWLGVTAENQRAADERIPILLDTPAAVRFVSVEPMLEAVNLYPALCGYLPPSWGAGPDIHWVICGAESGLRRRPFDVAWALDLYEQCKAAGVPYFSKQDSGLRPGVPLVLPGYGVVREWPA
jgi:protein gp37